MGWVENQQARGYSNTGSPASQPRPPTMHFSFPKLKEKLRGKWFRDAEETMASYKKADETTAQCEGAKCSSHWFHQMG
ncbi:hypothetical protein EVAR_54159_1 [Eumeta japonica]|uniref:Uncharacterized protein n=1 Tax=Eumeta variegata TaxID=151549 RepID=A0A4C1Y104_EUMVA|nr:hypothetical protein EVAR_54159_1 [Eumeta japonica]